MVHVPLCKRGIKGDFIVFGLPVALRSMGRFPEEEPCNWTALQRFQFFLKTCRP